MTIGRKVFYVLKLRRDVFQESGESVMILWRSNERGGEEGKMLRQLSVVPGPCALVHEQQEKGSHNRQDLHRDCLEEREDVVAIGCNFVRCITQRRIFLCCLLVCIFHLLVNTPLVQLNCVVVPQLFCGGLQSVFHNIGNERLQEFPCCHLSLENKHIC